jgi:enamine deaminase RidA (YjgF/YER057c/UK114 family)
MDRQNVSSGSPFEARIGLSRAVRIGQIVAVSGTAPLFEGSTVHPGDVYAQTKRCLQIMLDALATAGGSPQHVIRTRVMLTDIARWQDAARAHAEMFGEIRPANTFVEVSRFIDPEWLVETELDAVVT